MNLNFRYLPFSGNAFSAFGFIKQETRRKSRRGLDRGRSKVNRNRNPRQARELGQHHRRRRPRRKRLDRGRPKVNRNRNPRQARELGRHHRRRMTSAEETG